ncbi:hypothetical protein DFH09DRAFT_1097617 [Mycena vulgaris]|nr:hypothetical protein DFH09DRAFT_1097617 [Mycena vulgaris]
MSACRACGCPPPQPRTSAAGRRRRRSFSSPPPRPHTLPTPHVAPSRSPHPRNVYDVGPAGPKARGRCCSAENRRTRKERGAFPHAHAPPTPHVAPSRSPHPRNLYGIVPVRKNTRGRRRSGEYRRTRKQRAQRSLRGVAPPLTPHTTTSHASGTSHPPPWDDDARAVSWRGVPRTGARGGRGARESTVTQSASAEGESEGMKKRGNEKSCGLQEWKAHGRDTRQEDRRKRQFEVEKRMGESDRSRRACSRDEREEMVTHRRVESSTYFLTPGLVRRSLLHKFGSPLVSGIPKGQREAPGRVEPRTFRGGWNRAGGVKLLRTHNAP